MDYVTKLVAALRSRVRYNHFRPARSLAKYQLPIYITEHGSASTDEAFRATDLRENLAALHRAISMARDVRGFFYWLLLDNFPSGSSATRKNLGLLKWILRIPD